MRKLFIFDVDNTIVKGQSQRLLLSYLFRTKQVSFYYYILVLAWFIAYKFQITKDPRKVVSFAYSFLKGKSVDEIETMMDSFFEAVLKHNIFPEALITINNAKNDDNEIIFVSNAPSIIIKPLAKYLGVNTFFCTQLEIVGNKYTGKIFGDIMYGNNKSETLIKFCSERGYSLSEAMAYGDHVSDLPILEIVGHTVVINASKHLLNIATKKNWEIHTWNL